MFGVDDAIMWPLAGSLVSSAWSALEARSNRKFQERMSSTSHQREVADLRAAGLNPMLSARLGGSSTPGGSVGQVSDFGEVASRGINTAMVAKRQSAEIELLKAQAQAAYAGANKSNQEAMSVFNEMAPRIRQMESVSAINEMSVTQRKQMFELEIEKVKAEISATVATADRSRVLTQLDRLATTGAINEADFEKAIGQMSPATRWLINLARLYNLATGEPVRRVP